MGVASRERVNATSEGLISGYGERTIDVHCPSGKKVLFGGYVIEPNDNYSPQGSAGIYVLANVPLNGDAGWRVVTTNPQYFFRVHVYATCATDAPDED